MYADAGAARNSAVPTISSGVAIRPSGNADANWRPASAVETPELSV
jgi:hypothetical protein